jgi:hypothetical protein
MTFLERVSYLGSWLAMMMLIFVIGLAAITFFTGFVMAVFVFFYSLFHLLIVAI